MKVRAVVDFIEFDVGGGGKTRESQKGSTGRKKKKEIRLLTFNSGMATRLNVGVGRRSEGAGERQ